MNTRVPSHTQTYFFFLCGWGANLLLSRNNRDNAVEEHGFLLSHCHRLSLSTPFLVQNVPCRPESHPVFVSLFLPLCVPGKPLLSGFLSSYASTLKKKNNSPALLYFLLLTHTQTSSTLFHLPLIPLSLWKVTTTISEATNVVVEMLDKWKSWRKMHFHIFMPF